MKKRFWSLALTAVTVLYLLTTFSGISFAFERLNPDKDRFDGGDGTINSPYEIATLEQMEYLASITNTWSPSLPDDPEADIYFKLTADIGTEEEPLRTCIFAWDLPSAFEKPMIFFDGGGKTVYLDIKNKDIEDDDHRGLGLFGECCNVSIKDLVIEGSIDAGSYDAVGGVCGYALGNVEISGCVNNAAITGRSEVGGICGKSNSHTVISDCMNNAKITGQSKVGGICGFHTDELRDGRISNCWNTGSVLGEKDLIGGICGSFTGRIIEYCNNQTTVWGNYGVGGICGRLNADMNGCSAQGGVVISPTDKRSGREVGLLCGKVSHEKNIACCCAERSGNTNMFEGFNREYGSDNLVCIILPGKFAFTFPQNLEEAEIYKDQHVLGLIRNYWKDYYLGDDISEGSVNAYYTYQPADAPRPYSDYDNAVPNEEVLRQLLESAVIRETLAELGAVVERGDINEMLTKMEDIYPLWIEQIRAIRFGKPYSYVSGDVEKVDGSIVSAVLGKEMIHGRFVGLVDVEDKGITNDTNWYISEIFNDLVPEFQNSIREYYDSLNEAGTIFSGGGLVIICVIGGAAIAFLGVWLVLRRKNKRVLKNEQGKNYGDKQ